ncbi:DUF3369 domain-containing protein [Spirochaeta isovalerica]|uniref:Response regulator RpfG family c-di-GMP phosphodiesterase n=1 Tax=Spirochaeta isovalerica TaxID=150 RepID=A0A841RDZ9_9SPIO|nr:DUF3369 domain-containing protein [Spirochaeta isovalerica]MBB6481069.1 response regulator RpfG family c-di-GMP phosphodiesterase [Spirochaeta isovalerica]
MSDIIHFADESEDDQTNLPPRKSWKVLIVDDEEDIHQITKMVMDDFLFQERNIVFLDAYSGREARKIVEEHRDIAVILLDVVMETQTAGLDLVKYIREVLGNHMTRIVLRTGQPGSAPEKEVIVNYDINDYKQKTELTKSKLDTTLIAAIRAYRDLVILDKSRKGLTKIIDASSDIFEFNSMRKFIEGILLQLTSLLKLEEDTMYLETSAVAVDEDDRSLKIIAATGKYSVLADDTLAGNVPEDVYKLIRRSLTNKESFFDGNYYVGYFQSGGSRENILLLEGSYKLESTDRYLIDLFSCNINIAFENNYRHQEQVNTRDDILFKLGEATERHNAAHTSHVRRVGEIAFRLAEKLGMNQEQAEEIKIAAAMHDVGKILLNDNILHKSTALSIDEKEAMRHHTVKGEEILRNKKYQLLENAATVAAQHHERWDGTGYPKGLKGDQISLSSRITTLAMIYDALSHDQPYRKAWSEDNVMAFLSDNSGKIFDPDLVKTFVENYDSIKEVNKMYL